MSRGCTMTDKQMRTSLNRRACLSLLLLLAVSMTTVGCDVVGWTLDSTMGGPKEVKVAAEYKGLTGKRVAVIVAADEQTLYGHPGAPLAITKAVSAQLATALTDVKVANPEQVVEFQRKNPYWATLPYKMLLKKLEADRLIVIDLATYSTHEPGNTHVWRGVATASVSVAEADAENPNNLTYTQAVSARFPELQPVGVLDAEESTIALGLNREFATKVSRLFFEHQVTVK
jgi:hypothetical protein